MFNVDDNGIITITRGDTGSFILFINKGSKAQPIQYILGDKDILFLAVSEPNTPFENALLKKVYTKSDLDENNNVIIRLEHDDTKCLMPGKYYYTIKAKLINDKDQVDINTIIQNTEFFIRE